MRVLKEKERHVVVAVLDAIDRELRRCYWNANQKEMESPFDNSGTSYSNRAFSVRAYDWINDNGDNFVYPAHDLHVDWYKHAHRGVYVEVADDWTMDMLADMLDDCVAAIREDFGEEYD